MLKENYEELTTPTGAFITFEEDKGAEIALDHKKKSEEEIDLLPGQKFGKFSRAPEPTDIIWENRYLN